MKRFFPLVITLFLSILSLYADIDDPWKFVDSENNSFKIETFKDTVFDKHLPNVEISAGTYHNFGGATTVGFKIILRGSDIVVNDALFYKEAPEANIKNPMRLKKPFHLEFGNASEANRIDNVYVQLKFPYTQYFSSEDSLVVFTSKGEYVIYMDEERRAEARFRPILNTLNEEISHKDIELSEIKSSRGLYIKLLITLLCLSALICSFLIVRTKRQRIKQSDEMNRLLCLISENEMDNRRLKSAVSDLMKKHFDTINKLCGDYFEMADTPALKKIIYNKVEEEINRLKEAKNIKNLEETINRYCNNVMQKIEEQLPGLTDKERLLLIYLYSGMSARTICVLTDIQLKNFYMRRQRLKSKILASDAPDKEYFAEMM